MIYIIVDENYRFLDVKSNRAEAEQLVRELWEDARYIKVENDVDFIIIEKNI